MTDVVKDDSPIEGEVVKDDVVEIQEQAVLGEEFNINQAFDVECVVHLWEILTQEVIDNSISQLESAHVQGSGAMEKIEANGGKGNEDWTKLEGNLAEIVRRQEHIKKNWSVGIIIYKAKTKGMTQIVTGVDWNDCLERHVIVEHYSGADGKGKTRVKRVLPKPPI